MSMDGSCKAQSADRREAATTEQNTYLHRRARDEKWLWIFIKTKQLKSTRNDRIQASRRYLVNSQRGVCK